MGDRSSALVAEFAAGAGARGALKRSIFAVGDEKQSIFSFQGAAPQQFAQMRSDFSAPIDGSGLAFRPVEFKHSFRSGAGRAAMRSTHVFARRQAFARADRRCGQDRARSACAAQAPGLVEIWPLIEPDEKPQIEGWDAPFDTTIGDEPARQARAQDRRRRAHAGSRAATRVGDGDQRARCGPATF